MLLRYLSIYNIKIQNFKTFNLKSLDKCLNYAVVWMIIDKVVSTNYNDCYIVTDSYFMKTKVKDNVNLQEHVTDNKLSLSATHTVIFQRPLVQCNG